MSVSQRNTKLEAELRAMLGKKFPGVEISFGPSDRWKRNCVTFRWKGFADLLPEERFQRLATEISEEFREAKMKGCVWLELAPDETVDQFLKLPRSEDVAGREPRVAAELERVEFFAAMKKAMGANPKKKCGGDFSLSMRILDDKKLSTTMARDAKLLFIRHGAYCDCQVLESVAAELADNDA